MEEIERPSFEAFLRKRRTLPTIYVAAGSLSLSPPVREAAETSSELERRRIFAGHDEELLGLNKRRWIIPEEKVRGGAKAALEIPP